jgi:hypothetical protein
MPETPAPQEQNIQIVVRTKPGLLKAIDKWRAAQTDLPSRAEALRRFATKALATVALKKRSKTTV